MHVEESVRESPLDRADRLNAAVCSTQRQFLAAIAEIDRNGLWNDGSARDMAHWLWMRYGVSRWKAARWLDAARAMETLPRVADAFESGHLGIDKVVELCRFATPETEEDLLPWAERVGSGAIRRRAEVVLRESREEAEDRERVRSLVYAWEEDGRMLELFARLPAAAGAVVVKALDRLAERVPVMPGEEGAAGVDSRRADALVALCSARIATAPEADRATVVIHADLRTLREQSGGCAVEGGGVVPAATAERLLCTARVQTAVEGDGGEVLYMGRIKGDPPAWMMRQLRHRDGGCVFPGCGSRRYTHAHHIRWRSRRGTTDLVNLALLCGFHHKLPHEHGWGLRRERGGGLAWFRPDGSRYRAGPRPLARLRR